VATKKWIDMAPAPGAPDIWELLTFDRRHGVFLGVDKGVGMFAYKYKSIPGLSVDKETKRNLSLHLSASPNPFSGTTTISYQHSKSSSVQIAIYDAKGRKCREFIRTRANGTGSQILWDGKDRFGNPLSSGLYFVRISGPYETLSQPLILMR